MQNKLPTIHFKASLRVAKYVGILTSHFQIFLLTNLFVLFSISATAQQYEWSWAVSAGGVQGADLIYDVKVGSDNNYYFIGSLYGNIGVQLNGNPVDVYNSSLGGDDIFLFSTTCDGQIRWSQAIGGSSSGDFAYNLELDSNDNVYVGVQINALSTTVSFSPDANHSIAPLPNPQAYNRIYLVKYNSNGQYQGKKALQGTISSVVDSEAKISDIVIKNDTLHFIVGLVKGTHLDGNVTVPDQYAYDSATMTYSRQYHLVKYDTDLDYISSMVLPISADSFFPPGKPTPFAYDDILNHYYIANSREDGSNLAPFTYDNKTVVNRSYIIAFSGTDGSMEWLREIYSQPTNGQPISTNRITSLKIDTNSDIYIGGNVRKNQNETNLKIYDPTDASVQPYLFTPGADYGTLPMIAKLNSSGTVQWVQSTSAHDSTVSATANRIGKGIALNGNEVAFGVQGGADSWDAINIVRPLGANFQPDPVVVRFNKQTGSVINVHDILGQAVSTKQMSAVAVDNDGNYITGGIFNANLFMNNTLGIIPLVSAGNEDFFVAKLAASLCGTSADIDKFNKLNVNVYPNPTNDILNIKTQETLYNYEVYNLLGQQIQKGVFNNPPQIDLRGASSGIYLIKLATAQGTTSTVKVFKK
ncbi:T9SS type A sorting domain-containing protein [Myroides ceti]|uniref:T9SS type A sorting domain-containing protein n=1 Tax=Paenimyroides ceti TaxID=395087 RepID=A0ABT8CSU2_9FLAO|nr:T9SS type A sorting domain-containing protein [Paenimyroides ceti]MDN3706297.1 T9SS type A sorting domain-containing protein [Paenimyroides ceti]